MKNVSDRWFRSRSTRVSRFAGNSWANAHYASRQSSAPAQRARESAPMSQRQYAIVGCVVLPALSVNWKFQHADLPLFCAWASRLASATPVTGL